MPSTPFNSLLLTFIVICNRYLDRNQQVFNKHKEISPSRDKHDHNIPFLPGRQQPSVCPYKYPFAQKNDIEKIIKELLQVDIIHPSTNPYSSLVVMVLNKYGEWHVSRILAP